MSTTGGSWKDKPVNILITHEVKMKQERLVANCDGEVYWFGFVEQVQIDDETYMKVYDMILPKQEVSSGSVDFDGQVNDLVHDLIEQGREDDIAKMLFFAHSHANFGVFHSTTDVDQIMEWGEKAGVPFFISHVQNKKGEMDTRVDMFTDTPMKMHFTKEAKIISLIPRDIETWVKEQIAEKVTEKKHTYTTGTTVGHYHSPKVNAHEAKRRYPDAENITLRVFGKVRKLIVDGYVMEEEDTQTGVISYFRPPTDEERAADDAATGTPTGGRSVTRSDEKRAEGKVAAPQDGAPSQSNLVRLHQTQTARGVRSDELRHSSVLLLPPGSETDTEYMESILPMSEFIDQDEEDPDIIEQQLEEWKQTMHHFFGHDY